MATVATEVSINSYIKATKLTGARCCIGSPRRLLLRFRLTDFQLDDGVCILIWSSGN